MQSFGSCSKVFRHAVQTDTSGRSPHRVAPQLRTGYLGRREALDHMAGERASGDRPGLDGGVDGPAHAGARGDDECARSSATGQTRDVPDRRPGRSEAVRRGQNAE